MNQKEYELIADTLKNRLEFYHETHAFVLAEGVRQSMFVLMGAFERNYKNFNRDKFLTACGLEPVDNAN